MPKKMDLKSLEDAIVLAQSIKEFYQLTEILPELDATEQSLLFKAMGERLIVLIGDNEQFAIINSLVRNPEEFRLHLLTHLNSDMALLQLLTSLKQSLLTPLLLLGLTNPELVPQVRNDIIQTMKSFDTFLYYYNVLMRYCIVTEKEGHLFVRFLGESILMLRNAQPHLNETTACPFILNSYEYHQQHQDNILQRIRRSYAASFFIEQEPELSLINPQLLANFYAQHANDLIQNLLNNDKMPIPIKTKKLAQLILTSSSLFHVLSNMVSLDHQFALLQTLGRRFFAIMECSADYNRLYVQLQGRRSEILSIVVSLMDDKESFTHAVNHHYIVSKIVTEGNRGLATQCRDQFKRIITTANDLQQLKLSAAMRPGFEAFFAGEIASVKEESALFRMK